jgi:hypothetical protein
MSIDPNLTTDTCIFMNPGASPNWWLSDDVKITAPLLTGLAQPGVKNNVQLTLRRKPQGCALPDNTDFIQVDLYICNPTASPPVTSSGQVKKILDATAAPAEIIVDIANLPSGQFVKNIKWNLPAITGTSHPAETAGHKCLIARAYAGPLSPDPSANIGDHAQSLDQHYAQRNICIQTCDSPCGVDVWAENEDRERRRAVTFRVVADTNPTRGVLDVALPLLNQVPGFKRVVPLPPRRGFGLEFPDFPGAAMTDNTRPGCFSLLQKLFKPTRPGINAFSPSFEAQIKLAPQQLTTYRFMTDLDGASPGDAHIFHLMHVENDRVLSGLTLLMVKN